MRTDPHTVAILISAYNAEEYIVDAVRSALNQSYPMVSVWVMDDGSTDQTWNKLQELDDERLHIRSRVEFEARALASMNCWIAVTPRTSRCRTQMIEAFRLR